LSAPSATTYCAHRIPTLPNAAEYAALRSMAVYGCIMLSASAIRQ